MVVLRTELFVFYSRRSFLLSDHHHTADSGIISVSSSNLIYQGLILKKGLREGVPLHITNDGRSRKWLYDIVLGVYSGLMVSRSR